jgi:predicted nucleotide-binding protein
MTDLKPKIFIGSSSSGYEVAEEVKKYLSGVADAYLWKDSGVWEVNRSTFDNLLRMSNYFDFGVFVATSDDLTMTNDKLVIEPRDNVILEMALFLGAIGKDKSFLLVEEGIKLPSDFNGIYMPRFKRGDLNSIRVGCDEFIAKIDEHYQLGHLSLYPTTALAIGYYKNFLSGLVESVQSAMPIELEGVVTMTSRLR